MMIALIAAQEPAQTEEREQLMNAQPAMHAMQQVEIAQE